MPFDVLRRDFLKGAAAIAGATGGFSCVGISFAAPLEVPTVDKLAIRVLLDSSFDQFFRPATVKALRSPRRRGPTSAKAFTTNGDWRSFSNRSAATSSAT